MSSYPPKRCPHYQLHSEPLGADGPSAYLAVRRCLLTERLVRLLRQSEDGNQLAAKLTIHTADGRTYAFVGPDLEAVTQQMCRTERCEQQCTPAYTKHLDQFGVIDPGEEEATCNEEEETVGNGSSCASA